MTFPSGQSIAASVALLCVSMGVLAAPATTLRFVRTLRWERELSASVVMQLHAGNAELTTERSRDLVPTAASGVTIPRTPLATPDALLDDITSENAE